MWRVFSLYAMKLLITGSRKPTQRMLNVVTRLVAAAVQEDYDFIVGDADGIDLKVIQLVDHLYGKYAKDKLSVFGGYGKMRHRTQFGWNIPLTQTYPQRDWVMARQCHGCFAIWDGQSHGTQITFKAAHSLKKPTIIWNDKE